MDNLTVIDGSFVAQVGHILNVNPTSEPLLDLQVLDINQYAVYKTHMDYLRSGAKIIRADTCRTITKFVMKYLHVSRHKAKLIAATAVKIAKQAAFNYYEEMGGDIFNEEYKKHLPLIAGCCGSYGISRLDQDGPVEYWNFIPQQVIVAWHYSHIKSLLAAEVDLLAFESIPSLMEAKAMIKILADYFPEARAWITFLCSQEGKLVDGSSFAEAATFCYDVLPGRIIAIGADCPFPNSMKSLLRSINDSRDSKIPFMFYTNKHYLSLMENIDEYGVKLWDRFVQECLEIGIRYIGGGSNVDAEDIKKICKQIEIRRVSRSRTVTSDDFN